MHVYVCLYVCQCVCVVSFISINVFVCDGMCVMCVCVSCMYLCVLCLCVRLVKSSKLKNDYLCQCVYMYDCVGVCVYVCVFVCVCMSVCLCVCVYAYWHVCTQNVCHVRLVIKRLSIVITRPYLLVC